MRWHALFADIESQFAARQEEEFADEVAEFVDAEFASVTLATRLARHVGGRVVLVHRGGEVCGELVDAVATWALVESAHGSHLVPTAAIVAVDGLGPGVGPPPGFAFDRLTVGHALRALRDAGAFVTITTGDQVRRGRIERIGADHLDLRCSADEEDRNPGRRWTVALAAISEVRSD